MLRWDLTLVIYLVKQRVKWYFIISVAAKLLTCGDITVQLAEINNCEQTRPFTGYPLAAANITLVSTGLITKRQLTWRWREHQNHSINVKAIETKKCQYKFGWKKLSSTDVTHNTVADSRGSFVLKQKKRSASRPSLRPNPKSRGLSLTASADLGGAGAGLPAPETSRYKEALQWVPVLSVAFLWLVGRELHGNHIAVAWLDDSSEVTVGELRLLLLSGCRARTCLCCFLDSGTALAVIWNGGGDRALEGTVCASVKQKTKQGITPKEKSQVWFFTSPSETVKLQIW